MLKGQVNLKIVIFCLIGITVIISLLGFFYIFPVYRVLVLKQIELGDTFVEGWFNCFDTQFLPGCIVVSLSIVCG